MGDLKAFLDLLAHDLRPDERLTGSSFHGDPMPTAETDPARWRVVGLTRRADGRWCMPGNPSANRYVGVGAFRETPDGRWRRKKEFATGAVALMVDDLGTKVPMSAIAPLLPTVMVETSPQNFQAWFVFRTVERDIEKFDRLVKKFIKKFVPPKPGKAEGADPGMAGVTRFGRTPDSFNGKPVYGGWDVRVEAFRPFALYTVDLLAQAWGFDLSPPVERAAATPTAAELKVRIERHHFVMGELRLAGMVKGPKKSDGWTDVTCPWVDNHTGRADSGAAICEPNEINTWHGGFHCHHGGCLGKQFKHVDEWINDHAVESIEAANEQAASSVEDYL